MAYIIWLVLITLILISYLHPEFPLWITALAYLIAVGVRAAAKIDDYRDWKEKNKKDEKLKLEKIAADMANRHLTFGGTRKKAENKLKEDFEYGRNKRDRKFWVELVDTLFLK